jgi:N-dimethylarginine dimethylaminohydrolase
MFRIEHDAETGEIKEIQLNAADLALIEADKEPTNEPKSPTIAEKLESVGLSIHELKIALGL